MKLSIELEREDDGRWIAEISQLPGVLTYRPIAHGELPHSSFNLSFVVEDEQLASR